MLDRIRGRLVLADETDNTELKKRCNDQKFINNVQFTGSIVKTVGATPERLYIELTIDG